MNYWVASSGSGIKAFMLVFLDKHSCVRLQSSKLQKAAGVCTEINLGATEARVFICYTISSLVCMCTKHLAMKHKLKFAELEIQSCAWRWEAVLLCQLQSMLTWCLNRCLGQWFFSTYFTHLLRKPANFVLLCETMANFCLSMHLLLAKMWHKQD